MIFVAACMPQPQKYPYRSASDLVNEAQGWSKKLERYIYGWLAGQNAAQVPDSIIPTGFDTALDCKKFYLQKFEDINPKTQWAVRLSRKVNVDSAYGGVPDPHVTYLLLGASYVPFGSKVIIEGEFPYCRFFSVQVSPPFNGKEYCPLRGIGPCEVSVADVDIKPLKGHINPFLPGANRLATNRKYRIEIEMATGDPVELNPDFKFPYTMKQPIMYGGLLQNRGPWGKFLNKKEGWNLGALWIRYYAPDSAKGALAGVPLPKVYYQLPTGETYFMNADLSNLIKLANKPFRLPRTRSMEPTDVMGPNVGWGKSFGILQSIGQGLTAAMNRINSNSMKYVREADLGATGRGEDQAAPANYEPHATTNNYATYLGRGMNLGKEKVIILTGKLPEFPNTRHGAETMNGSQLRYFSICGYVVNLFYKSAGCAAHSVMDDELILNKRREYILVYSRAEDRPKNATPQNGVTWVDWGPTADLALVLRWVSVSKDWLSSPNPHEAELPWKQAALCGTAYNKRLLNINDTLGHLKSYQPIVHYMTKKDFESLGNTLDARKVPDWRIYR